MRPSREPLPVPLAIKAFYSVAELAQVGRISTYTLLRLLRRNRVTFLHLGRSLYVPLSEIRDKIPPLWEGLRACEQLRVEGPARAPAAADGRRRA